MATEVLGIRCNDRKPEDGHFGGWISWEKLMESMERQRQLPFEERVRPCLKHNDWWIYQAQCCAICEKAIWDLSVNGERRIARQIGIKGKRVELACKTTGEVFTWMVGKGFVE